MSVSFVYKQSIKIKKNAKRRLKRMLTPMEISGLVYVFEFVCALSGTLAFGALYVAMSLTHKEQSLDCQYYAYHGPLLMDLSDVLVATTWLSVLTPWISFSHRPSPVTSVFVLYLTVALIFSYFVRHERKRHWTLTKSLNELDTKYGTQTHLLYPLFNRHGMECLPITYIEGKAIPTGTKDEKRKQIEDYIQSEIVSALLDEEAGRALCKRSYTLKRTIPCVITRENVIVCLTNLMQGEEPCIVKKEIPL